MDLSRNPGRTCQGEVEDLERPRAHRDGRTGLVDGFYNVVTFLSAFALMWAVRRYMAVAVIPRSHYGVYMGIINRMIVIPMLIQTVTFGTIYDHLLGADPSNALMFAGVLPFLAAGATTMIARPRGEVTQNMPMDGGLPAE